MTKNRVACVTDDEQRRTCYATANKPGPSIRESFRSEALAFEPGPRAVCQNFCGFCLVVVLC